MRAPGAPLPRPRAPRRGRAAAAGRARAVTAVALLDYVAAASDDGVLRLPPRTELDPDEIRSVFGYPRKLHENYFIGRVIGAGSFGTVREGTEALTGRRYAIKTVSKIPKRGPPTPRYLLKLRAEVEVMAQLGVSLNAVHLQDVYEDDSNIHMVMELCEGGALLERVEARAYSEAYIAGLVRSILRFIAQCHAKGIVYRDVKPDNFLFLTKEEDSPLKATDFGLSIRHSADEPKLTSRSGTPAYMSPELVMQCYDEKADIWSVGMLGYQLLTGRFPFWEDVRNETLSDVWKAVLSQEIDWDAPELRALSPAAVALLQRLLQRNPLLRPSAAEALDDLWLAEGGAASDAPLKGSVVARLQRFATYSHLKQLVLRMITEDMRRRGGGATSLAAALQDLFSEYDADASGSISFDELASGLQRQGYEVNESEVRQLMDRMDVDHNGNVEGDEFVAALIDWGQIMQTQEWSAYVDAAFSRLDVDGDGFIELEELTQRLPADFLEGNDAERLAEAKRMLREADANGDGRISRAEFSALLRETVAPDSLSLYDSRLRVHASPAA
ncbi:calcium dependent kinase [Raphidocelis subcapitata]|uniref:Calcium dependent kinase n=1 Tax=Raphidocelis subcapitata TaxID=307507 RepID=A0A2V0PEV2_9CHLO|nr:calcium dependent kinase [Raphidocelis subcapitata]|eukprot:GBF98366.1 calcium dependent kinase [Raphidocelis subcapitata]